MEKILTYMNNDRKRNLSVVSSFSHFVESYMVARKIRAHDGDMQGEREPSLPACFSVYNEVFNSNSHWDCLPVVLCHYSNCLSVLNVLLR